MKILMFGWEFPPYITGGLGTACFGLSQSLTKMLTKLVFVLPRAPGAGTGGSLEVLGASDLPVLGSDMPPAVLASDEGPCCVEIHTVDSPLRPYQGELSYRTDLRHAMGRARAASSAGASGEGEDGASSLLGHAGSHYGGNLFEEVQRFARLASRAVRREAFDVIHAHDWLTFPAAVLAKQKSGLPLVVHVHATEFDRCGEQIDHRVYEIERRGMEAADRIVAVSQRTKDMIVARYGIAGEKVIVVHNGVVPLPAPPTRHLRLDGTKLVVFLGRITMQKGPEYFMEAAFLVAKALPQARFVMAGTGDMMPQMIERMAQSGILDRFHFTGFVGEAQRNALFSQADVFVLSSVSEPFGITPMEAMQYGVPVITTKQSGVSEVVFGALKVDFWDVRRMADAIINVLKHPPLAADLVKGAHRDLETLTWDLAASKVVKVYQEVV